MNNFDKVVMGALDIAQSKAMEFKNTELAPLHLLFGLISNPSSYASKSLSDQLSQVEELVSKLPRSSQNLTVDQIRPSANLSSWLTQAGGDAAAKGKQEISEKNLLKFYLITLIIFLS